MRDNVGSGNGVRAASGAVRPAPMRRRRGKLAWLVALVGAVVVLVSASAARLPTQPANPTAAVVVASIPFWNLDHGASTVLRNRGAVGQVSPWVYGLTEQGQISVQYPPEQSPDMERRVAELRGSALNMMPTLANVTHGSWAYEPVARIIHDPGLRREHAASVAALVRDHNYTGIDLDYEDLHATDRDAFSAFVAELAAALHAEHKMLSVAVFAKATDAGVDERNVAQDYAAIGRLADQVRVMGYDYHWNTSPPGPVAPLGWIRDVLNYTKTRIPPPRIVLGVPLYGYDWVGTNGSPISWAQAMQLANAHGSAVGYDTADQAPWFAYTDELGRRHDVWFENQASSAAKLRAVHEAGISNVYLWMFGPEDPGTWSALRQSLPQTSIPLRAWEGASR